MFKVDDMTAKCVQKASGRILWINCQVSECTWSPISLFTFFGVEKKNVYFEKFSKFWCVLNLLIFITKL